MMPEICCNIIWEGRINFFGGGENSFVDGADWPWFAGCCI